jgi:hypothetical protein
VALPSSTLLVTGLPTDGSVTSDMLRHLFGTYPGLADLRHVAERGIAFVDYSSEPAATVALQASLLEEWRGLEQGWHPRRCPFIKHTRICARRSPMYSRPRPSLLRCPSTIAEPPQLCPHRHRKAVHRVRA